MFKKMAQRIAESTSEVIGRGVLVTDENGIIIGCAILIGFIAGVAAGNADTSENAVLFWKTGVCGGFTTFSTFSLEALTLLEKKAYLAGSCYIILSVVFCLAGVICGRRLAMLLH